MNARRDDMAEKAAQRGERKGFYIRPSAAIERGGGFFIPGLEGRRLRVAISGVVVALLAVNRGGTPLDDVTSFQLVSEAVAVVAATFLLFSTLDSASSETPTDSQQWPQQDELVLNPQLPSLLGKIFRGACYTIFDKTKGCSGVILFANDEPDASSGAICSVGVRFSACEKAWRLGSPLSALEPQQSLILQPNDGVAFERLVAFLPPNTSRVVLQPAGPGLFWLVGIRSDDGGDSAVGDCVRWAKLMEKLNVVSAKTANFDLSRPLSLDQDMNIPTEKR